MDPDIVRMAQIAVIMAALGGFGTALYLVTRLVLRWTDRKALPAPAAPRLEDDRMARLEQAVDSIALEVERIGEAQRFSAQLMSKALESRAQERLPEPRGPERRVITPH